MADLIPTDPQQQLLQSNAASQQPNPPAVAADALGSTRSVETTPKALIGDVGDDELVSSQIKKLISDDSPVLQQARARSQQYAAGRGLQNSSIAAEAGEQAVIAAAAPIASADASTISNRRSQNLSTANQFGLNEQGHQQQRQLIEDQTDANSRLQGEAAEHEIGRLREQGTINERLQRLASADEITRMREQGAITERLNAIGFDQDVQRIREQGSVNERLQTLDQNFRSIQADLDRGATLDLEDKRFQNNQALLVSEYAQRAGLSSQEADQEMRRLNQAHLNTLDEIRAQTDAAGKEVGPKLQAQYLAAVSDRMAAASAEIQMIYQTQGLKAADQQAAAIKANERMRSDLSQLGAYYRQSPLWDDDWGGGDTGIPTPAPTGQQQLPANLSSFEAWARERGHDSTIIEGRGILGAQVREAEERRYRAELERWQSQNGGAASTVGDKLTREVLPRVAGEAR